MTIATVATLGIIIRTDWERRKKQILLGIRKGEGIIGEGLWCSPGGKKKEGETVSDCVRREAEEEVGISPDPAKTEERAIITFFSGGRALYEGHIFLIRAFRGEPHETDAMIPRWFDDDVLSTSKMRQKMFESDCTWLPAILRGERFRANAYYREPGKGFLGIAFYPFG